MMTRERSSTVRGRRRGDVGDANPSRAPEPSRRVRHRMLRRASRAAALAASCAGLLSTTPSARPDEPRLLETPEPAVARVNHAGYRDKRHCTGFAIADRAAITAAHCIAGIDPRGMHVLFGYARMEWRAHGRPESAAILGNDVAVLCLAEAAPARLPVADEPVERGDTVRVLGYGRPSVHAVSETRCNVRALVGDELLLDCAQSPGASGGPVIDETGAVVAVMSRTSRASSRASLLPDGARARCP